MPLCNALREFPTPSTPLSAPQPQPLARSLRASARRMAQSGRRA